VTTSAWYDRIDIQAAGMDLEAVSDFCYLDSYISYNGSCEKNVRVCKSGGGYWKDKRGLEKQ